MQLLDDSIAAIVTPIGIGGVGIVRISGPDSYQIGLKISGKNELESHRVYHVWLQQNIDETLITFFKSPASFTGQDILEISAHGSQIILHKILHLMFKYGCRQAEKGEFSKRAFLNGKIDLVQAEAIQEMIQSQANIDAENATSQLKGSLSIVIKNSQKKLLNLLAGIQAVIDFPDDVLLNEKLLPEIEDLSKTFEEIASTFEFGKRVKSGLNVAIIGKPNVGKSTLLNALLKEDRAIVSSFPGTTRDTIIETINIGGLLVRLTDTAGIRDHENPIEKLGIEKALDVMGSADIVMVVLDASKPLDRLDLELLEQTNSRPRLLVLNKSDLGVVARQEGICISASTGNGLSILENSIFAFGVKDKLPATDIVVTSARQAELLHKAKNSLQNAIETVKMGRELDLVSIDIQEALASLGELLGSNIGDLVLDSIFSRFCVGK